MKQTNGVAANAHLEIIALGDSFIFKFTSKGMKMMKAGQAFEKAMVNGDKQIRFMFMSHERYVTDMLPKIKAAQQLAKQNAEKKAKEAAGEVEEAEKTADQLDPMAESKHETPTDPANT